MDELDDYKLIHLYLDGDAHAFDVIYERYRKVLYGYLNGLLQGQNALADDVFQQTWLNAIQSMPKYRNQEKFSAWLMRIAHNLVMDHYRSSRRRKEETFDEIEENVIPAPESASPQRRMDRKELAAALEEAVRELSPELREVFLLRQKDVPFREIAVIQKCSINTCLARMQYAVKKMRVRLHSWMPENG